MQIVIRVEDEQTTLHLVPGPKDTTPPSKAVLCLILLAQAQALIASSVGVPQAQPEGRKIVLANALPAL